jgi:hypothetical protein
MNDACVFGYSVTLPSSTRTVLTGHLQTLGSVRTVPPCSRTALLSMRNVAATKLNSCTQNLLLSRKFQTYGKFRKNYDNCKAVLVFHSKFICYSYVTLKFMTCGAALNTASTMDAPWHTYTIFITVSKVSYIFHKVPDCLTATTQPHNLTLPYSSCCYVYLLRLSPNKSKTSLPSFP